ncbi:MAG: NUDIX hydrolase [Candidatus Saccharimonadales bacterium]
MQKINGLVAKCLVVNVEHRVLLLTIGEHTKYPRLSYSADLPGGIIEKDEQPRDGVVREIYEETGIVVDPAQLHKVSAMTTIVPGVDALVEKQLYIVRTSSLSVTLSYEHESYRWVTLDELLHTSFSGFYFDDFIEKALMRVVDERLIET